MVIDGARGIGKTVLLTELEDIARRHGWVVLRASGRQDSVDTLVNTTIPAVINELSPGGSRALTGVQVAGVRVETEVYPPTEPVPTLGTRMRELLSLLHGTGILITVDEVQDADPTNLAQIALTHQDLLRDDHHVALIMAGLTHGVNELLDMPGTTFLRRARRFEIGPLTRDDTRNILVNTAEQTKPFDPDAAQYAIDIAQGYPYLVQLVGYLAWNHATNTITLEDVQAIKEETIDTVGFQVHAPSLKGVPRGQRAYLRAAARVMDEDGLAATGDIAKVLDRTPNSITDTRAKLLDRGLIDAPVHGKISFPLPYFAEYLSARPRPRRVS